MRNNYSCGNKGNELVRLLGELDLDMQTSGLDSVQSNEPTRYATAYRKGGETIVETQVHRYVYLPVNGQQSVLVHEANISSLIE